jgi:hypothetical protein
VTDINLNYFRVSFTTFSSRIFLDVEVDDGLIDNMFDQFGNGT